MIQDRLDSVHRYFAMRAVGSLANTILQFAVPILVYQTTRSIAWSGMALAVEWVPRIVSLPVAGVLVDRFGVRRVYVVSDAGRAVAAGVVAATTAVAPAGAQIAALVGLALVAGACYEQTFVAGEKAVRLIVPLAGMDRAQSVLGGIDQACALAGPALGAVLLLAGRTATVAVIGSLFACSLVLALRLREAVDTAAEPAGEPGAEADAEPAFTVRGFRRQLVSSGRIALGEPILRTVIMVTFGVNLLGGLVLAGAPAVIERAYGASASSLGVVYTAAGLASMAVLAGTAAAMRRFGTLHVGIGSALLTCVAFTLSGLASGLAAFGALVVVMFAAQSVFTVFIRVVRAHIVPPREFAGVVSVILLLNFAALPVAGLLLAASRWVMPVTELVEVTGAAVLLVVVALLHRLGRLMPQERDVDRRWVVPALRAAEAAVEPVAA